MTYYKNILLICLVFYISFTNCQTLRVSIRCINNTDNVKKLVVNYISGYKEYISCDKTNNHYYLFENAKNESIDFLELIYIGDTLVIMSESILYQSGLINKSIFEQIDQDTIEVCIDEWPFDETYEIVYNFNLAELPDYKRILIIKNFYTGSFTIVRPEFDFEEQAKFYSAKISNCVCECLSVFHEGSITNFDISNCVINNLNIISSDIEENIKYYKKLKKTHINEDEMVNSLIDSILYYFVTNEKKICK